MKDDGVVRLDREDLEKARELNLQEQEARALGHLAPNTWVRVSEAQVAFHEQLASKYDLFGVGAWSIQLANGEIIVDVNKRSLHRADPEE